MFGSSQLPGCCFDSPAILNPPDFPGQKKLKFSCNGSYSGILNNSGDTATTTATAVCTQYQVALRYSVIGYNVSDTRSVNHTSTEMTRTLNGSVSLGFCWYSYATSTTGTGSAYIPDIRSYANVLNPTTSIAASGVKFLAGPLDFVHFADEGYCDYPAFDVYRDVVQTTVAESVQQVVLASFNWLAKAQKEIAGIRLKLLSSTAGAWFVTVQNGVVNIFNDSPTSPYSLTFSGTFNTIATAINASSISTYVQARSSSWAIFASGATPAGERAGAIAANENKLSYIFTGEDQSTMLKNITNRPIVSGCVEPGAPLGWTTSTRLPVYYRDEIVPPRGVVRINGIAKKLVGGGPTLSDAPFFINEYSQQYPTIGSFGNNDAGALQFVTTTYHFPPDKTAPNAIDPLDVYWGSAALDPTISYRFGGSSYFLETSRRLLETISTTPNNFSYSNSFTDESSPDNVTLPVKNQVVLGSCPLVPPACFVYDSCSDPCLNGLTSPAGSSCICPVQYGCRFSACVGPDNPFPCGSSDCANLAITWEDAVDLVVPRPDPLVVVKSQSTLGFSFV